MVKKQKVRDESIADPDEPRPPKCHRSANRGGRPRLQMTPQEREWHRKEQLRRAKANFKEKLKSSAPEDIEHKARDLQKKRMRLMHKMTLDSAKDMINQELHNAVLTILREFISELEDQEQKLDAMV